MLSIGCVLADPPEHGRAIRTAPILSQNQAKPSVFVVDSVSPGESIPINVPLRSEDVGENLLAELHLDYAVVPLDQSIKKAIPVAAGTFEDTDRAIETDWDVPSSSKGCHALTLLVTHDSNLEPRNLEDIATVTWWFNIADDDGAPNEMRDCPTVTGSTN